MGENEENDRIHKKGYKREQARALLLSLLADGGWHPSAEIIEEARSRGISHKTLRRAKRGLPISVAMGKRRNGRVLCWYWQLTGPKTRRPVDIFLSVTRWRESGRG